jgi:multicomponent Na+:H+ antiporter subunit D
MTRTVLLQAAVLGPAAAGLLWLATSRWVWVRRIVGGLVALAAHASAWAVLWLAYRGDPVRWRSFEADLLGASLAVAAEIAALVVAVRADGLGRWAVPATCALAVASSAVVATAFARSLAVQAVLLPIPTLAAAVAGVAGRTRRDLRGILGLAAADGVALLGLSVVFARVGTTAIGPEGGVLGGALLVAAGAVKAGALPGVGTWRLAVTDGPGAPVSVSLRAQGVALAMLGGLVVVPGEPHAVTVGVAAGAVLGGGVAAVAARTPNGALAGVSGAAAAVLCTAVGLGGAVGIRAALVLFPAFLLSAGAAFALGWHRRVADEVPAVTRPAWTWLGVAALAVAVVSLAGLPPGGGFPGTWLVLSLAGSRGAGAAPYYLAAGAVGLGAALAAVGAAPVLRAARGRAGPAALGAIVAGALLYTGLLPVRLGIGWWLRIERDLGAPLVLTASGPPELPAVGGLNLALILAEGAILAGAVLVLARGFRRAPAPAAVTTPAVRRPARFGRWGGAVRPAAERLTRVGAGLAAAVLLEAAALVLAGRLVLLAARGGFL